MGALIVLSVVAAGAAGVWAAKVLKERAARQAAIAEEAHEVAIAELVVMAMLADGELTTEEWGVVRGEFGARGYSLLETDNVIGELRDDAERVRAEGTLQPWVTQESAGLSAADRELVYELVVELVLKGSVLSGPSGEYRPADGQPTTLLRCFGDGLGLHEARQRARPAEASA
ncbi:MAG: hypothetical protein H6719_34380 [Sandaracinaceae bacterium]|nr:hypothetical protein [Sandaracinaceae bacterium]